MSDLLPFWASHSSKSLPTYSPPFSDRSVRAMHLCCVCSAAVKHQVIFEKHKVASFAEWHYLHGSKHISVNQVSYAGCSGSCVREVWTLHLPKYTSMFQKNPTTLIMGKCHLFLTGRTRLCEAFKMVPQGWREVMVKNVTNPLWRASMFPIWNTAEVTRRTNSILPF